MDPLLCATSRSTLISFDRVGSSANHPITTWVSRSNLVGRCRVAGNHLVGLGGVPIVSGDQSYAQGTPARPVDLVCQGHHLRHRMTGAADDDLFATFHPLDNAGEVGFASWMLNCANGLGRHAHCLR